MLKIVTTIAFLGFVIFFHIVYAVPLAPTDLTVTVVSSSQIDLSWNDNSSDEIDYLLYRSLDSSLSNPTIIPLVQNSENYSDIGLSEGVNYYYRVFACNLTGCVGSNVVSGMTLSITPPTTTEIGSYGVVFDPDTGNFSGLAWGGDVVGWIAFGEPECNFCTVRGVDTNRLPVVSNVRISNGPIPDQWCAPSAQTFYSVSWNYSDEDNDPRTRAEIEFVATNPADNYLAQSTSSDGAANQNYLLYDPITEKLKPNKNYSARVRVFDGKDWSLWVNSLNSTTTIAYYPPLVDFSWSPSQFALGTIVTFNENATDRSSGSHPLSSWNWTFVNGTPNSSAKKIETVIFSSLSAGNTSLEVTDDNDVSCTLTQTAGGGGTPSKRRVFREK